MYLKTLKIRGFKSFASLTTFEFEPGITAVVGPNGSGKSNVVDALAWVMGEQGAKNLRGGKMEDVIFAGTSGREPLGRAQVELTIDNSDGLLPIEYSEVTISRTLFRSGGSEYHINGHPARLLDIQELLSDSGLGREMHVIVGQGQLDRILQATPEERRGFIEEASGVLKHRRRKERSERKLDAMRANLDRIRDLSEEVHRQLGPLSRQAATARKAQGIQFDVRDAKTRLLADDVTRQITKLAQLKTTQEQLESEQSGAQTELERVEALRGQVKTQLDKTQQATAAAREHRFNLVSVSERLRSLGALSKERLRSFQSSSPQAPELTEDQAQRHVEEAEDFAGSAAVALQQLRDGLAEATEAREQAEHQARVAAETYTAVLQSEADHKRTLAVAESRHTAAQHRLDALNAQQEQAAQRDSELAGEAEQLTKDHEELGQELREAEQSRDEAKGVLGEAKAALAHHQERENVLRSNVSGLQAELSGHRARAEVLERSLQPEPGSPEDQLKDFAPIHLGQALQVEPGWENAVATALEGQLDGLIMPGSTLDFDYIAGLLAEAGSSRIYAEALGTQRMHPQEALGDSQQASAVVRYRDVPANIQAILDNVLSTVLLVEDLSQARELIADPGFLDHSLVVTRSGVVLAKSRIDFPGPTTPHGIEQQAEFDQASASVDEAEKQLKTAREELEAFNAELAELRRNVDSSSNAYSQATHQLTVVEERHRSMERQIERVKRDIAGAQKQHADFEADLAKAQQQFKDAQVAFQSATQAQAATEGGESVATVKAQQDQAEDQARRARQTETEARLTLRSAESEGEQADRRVEQAKRRLSATQIAHQEYLRQRQRHVQSTKRLSQLGLALDRVLASIQQSVARAEQDHDALLAQQQDQERRGAEIDKQLNQQRKQVEALSTKIHQHYLTQQEQQLKHDQLVERALDELGYTEKYLLAHFGPDLPVPVHDPESAEHEQDDTESTEDSESTVETVPFVRAEQEKRLRKAQRDLRALGKVNPLALEEYQAVQERHQYLSEQLADLEESRRQLLDIIADVDATVLKVFSSAFEDTAEEFQHVFATLFPGGEGRLYLTEPDSMLETGIEVEARPAGKKVKRLSLLSGGERSLAAVAMLVSIFKARPSPFYVMDEVEAALDDTNLSRLLTIFKELQQDSQLIIITHQKRTMEIADALYGVSMRGDGISTVLSQSLKDLPVDAD